MTSVSAQTGSPQSPQICDDLLLKVLGHSCPVWIVAEDYLESGPMWRITLVLQEMRSIWVRRRYKYDISCHVLYFVGEQPLEEDDARVLRRQGRRLC
jgi:hypothetical protein